MHLLANVWWTTGSPHLGEKYADLFVFFKRMYAARIDIKNLGIL